MANMRKMKGTLRQALAGDGWEANLAEIAAQGSAAVGPLFSFLLLDPPFMHRAAAALGATVAAIYARAPESARNIIRRFMWHMNEDSGNIGWGIPVAFAETLARSPGLAREYGHILLSYIMDLGFADNYCDNDMLRRDCYWAVGRLLQAQPEFCARARPWLIKGLEDGDLPGRGLALWALGKCPPVLSDVPAVRKFVGCAIECDVYEDGQMQSFTFDELARRIL